MTDPIRVGRFDWERAILAEPSITGLHLCAALALGTFMKADGSKARPGFPLLSRMTGVGESTLRRYLAASTARGWLVLVRRGHRLGDGTVVANEYAASVPASTALPGERLSPDVEEASTAPLAERLSSLPPAQPLPQPLARGAPIKGTGEHKDQIRDDRNLRSKKKDLDTTIIDTLRQVTGKTIPATWVPNVKRAIFGGDGTPSPDIKDPAAYAHITIINEPNPVTRFLPSADTPRLVSPQPAEHREPAPPPQPAPNGTPDGATAPPMTDAERQAMVAEALADARRRREARQRTKTTPRTPAAPRDATAEEQAHQREQIAVAKRYAEALAGGMGHEQAEQYARKGE